MKHILVAAIFIAMFAASSGAEEKDEYRQRPLNVRGSLSEPARARITRVWDDLNRCLNGCLVEAARCLEQVMDAEGGPLSCETQHQQCDSDCFKQFRQ